MTIDGHTYHSHITYDATTGQQTTLTYPNGVVLGSRYNARGYLTDLINANSGYVYQHLDSVDAQGQFTQYTLGHGKLTATASTVMTPAPCAMTAPSSIVMSTSPKMPL